MVPRRELVPQPDEPLQVLDVLARGFPQDLAAALEDRLDVVDALRKVGGRIDQMWEKDGATWFTGDEPDDDDPAYRAIKRIDDLELHSRIADRWTEVARILLEAADTDEAVALLAPVLGVDEVQVLTRLNRFSLFTVTRGARAARAESLKDLRQP